MADTLLGALRNLALDQLRSKLKKKQYNQVVSPSYLLYLSAANTERVAEEDERSPCVIGRLPGANLARYALRIAAALHTKTKRSTLEASRAETW